MKIFEYQAKELFDSYNIKTPKGGVCYSVQDAIDLYAKYNVDKVVIKAQVHVGGRGKAGGIKIANNINEVENLSNSILGMQIKGLPVDRVMIAEAVDIQMEYYLSFTIDRNSKSVILILSEEGGVDIEDIAAKTPHKILKFPIDPTIGVPDFFAQKAAYQLTSDKNIAVQIKEIIKNLYMLFIQKDCSLTEINPLVITKDGNVVAVDGKINFDDNALYRHPEILELNNPTEEEKKELNAKESGFSYIHIGGDIGCMVNGAGLAMATMDMIKLYGGEPANFLDIGGSSNPNKVIEAMKLLLSDKQVKVVLINIFGGITRCDDVAKGLLEAFSQIKTDIPVVIRLSGTNDKEGRELLKDSSLHIEHTMGEAISKAVELSKLTNPIN